MNRIPTEDKLQQSMEQLAEVIGRDQFEGDPMVSLMYGLLKRHFALEENVPDIGSVRSRTETDDEPATEGGTLHFVRRRSSMPEAESSTGRDLELYITFHPVHKTCYIHLSTIPSNRGDPHWSSLPAVPIDSILENVDNLLEQVAACEM